jgi:tetratricopeptide (TPR) repeat protein/tRNA A-37 threonylcarbamoyl transferase component Bud32
MEADRWREINRLYHLALDLEPTARPAFLEQACSGDRSLKRGVLSLLEFADETGSFPGEPDLAVAGRGFATSSVAGANRAAVPPPLPATIGRYRVIGLLGEGGMGIVYEAEQDQPRRRVALKIIKPGLAVGQRLLRFKHEAQALGRLQHPGIAQIYEASTADTGFGPQPYFAMELIRGLSLQEYAQANSLNIRQRLSLMVKICEAVNHAHLRGLIHRDLKPGNILVDETGQPKVLDFGVARVTASDEQATRQTDIGQIVGTLAYMSPEQVLADPLELDTRSDVYSLGVILYEQLSGQLPYNVSDRPLHAALQTIREDDPTTLRSINRQYRGDVETIVGKAMEKDKARRYASAADLAADIQRYLEDQPIAARPPSASYQLQKFARRHKALVAALAAVFVVLVGGVVVSTSQAVRANRAGRAALTERDRASAAQRAATEERDRALKAEAAATSERNRALAAEEQVVQERDRVLLEKRRADDETATAQAVNNFLQDDVLAQASARVQSRPDTKPDPELKVRTALDRAAAAIPGKFDRQPAVEASIRQTIGKAYFDLGVYPEAQRHWERAAELRQRTLGPDHPDTLTSLNDLADAYRVQSAYKQAEPLFIKVLQTRRRVLGGENPATLSSMNELANLYLNQDKNAQAEPLLVKALAVQRRVLGPDHPDTLTTLHDLATTYVEEGKFGQAEPLEIQALEARRRVLGQEHPQTGRSMNELGWLYRQEGKYAQAESLLNAAVEVQRRVLGEEHSDTLTSMNNLGLVYRSEGKYQQAEAMYIRVLEIRRRVLGTEHADTLISMNNLAVLYVAEGKFAQAETLYSGALDIQRRLFGEQRPTTIHFLANLGGLYREEGKYAQADAALTQALEVRRRVLGEAHPDTLRSMLELGLLYRDEGKYMQAEQLLSQVLEIQHRVLAAEHPDTLRSMSDLGALYHAEGKDGLAEPLLIKALELRRRVLGPANPDSLDTVGSLAEVELQEQKYADAEPLLREAVGTTEKTSPDTWNRYYFQTLLGASLSGQKRFAEAEPLLVSGRQGMLQREASIPADRLSHVVQAGQRIVELYENWGKLEKAAEWRQKVQAK